MQYIIKMLLLRSFSLFLSATLSLAARFPRRGIAGKSISPMITGRDLSAPSPVCGAAGTDKEKPAAYSGPHASSVQDCLAKYRGSSGCQSVALTVLPLSASYTELQSLATSTMMQVRLTCSTTFRTLKEDRLVLYRS
jgi:hypothetical protein